MQPYHANKKILELSSFIIIVLYRLSFNVKLVSLNINIICSSVWTWTCTDHGCKKSSVGENNTSLISENVCNLLCPPGNLWPQPTGRLEVSAKYVAINLDHIVLNVQPRKQERGMFETSLNGFISIFSL